MEHYLKDETMKQIIMLMMLLLSSFAHNIAFAYNDSNLPVIIQGEPGKLAGDIIAPITLQETAAWCDFSKSIIQTNRGFLCVFNGKPVPPSP
jgi:hypothetical protein